MVLLAGCGGKDEAAGPDYLTYPLAADIVIDKVSWYQGVEKALYVGPGMTGGGSRPPPIIIGREAMVRVAVSALDEYDPNARDVAIVLQTDGGGYTSSRGVVVDSADWEESELETTGVFPLPGEYVNSELELTVTVHEVVPDLVNDGSTDETVWSSADEGLDIAASDVETLVIVPIRYLGDGTGRLPDTSPARLAQIADAYTAMYPVTELRIEVRPAFPWANVIDPFSGWDALLAEISSQRGAAVVAPNTYYYGLFDPADSLESYCAGGCILGLSNLGTTTDPSLQASIGLGFDSEVVRTLVHEVGHAHGRDHAPCELLGQPSDPGYPYPNARLGSWGYDIGTRQLVDPQASADMMSYCKPQWVSDYTFTALFDRIVALRDRAGGPQTEWQRLLVDGEGDARPYGTLRAGSGLGLPASFDVFDADGADLGRVAGSLVPYSHLPGGTALVPSLPVGAVGARLVR
jgi:hypothetical protein